MFKIEPFGPESECTQCSLFGPVWPRLERADWYQLACLTGGLTGPTKKKKKNKVKAACNTTKNVIFNHEIRKVTPNIDLENSHHAEEK